MGSNYNNNKNSNNKDINTTNIKYSNNKTTIGFEKLQRKIFKTCLKTKVFMLLAHLDFENQLT